MCSVGIKATYNSNCKDLHNNSTQIISSCIRDHSYCFDIKTTQFIILYISKHNLLLYSAGGIYRCKYKNKI